MTEIWCSLPTDIIYFKLPAEKVNIRKNRYSRIFDNGSGHLFIPCVGLNVHPNHTWKRNFINGFIDSLFAPEYPGSITTHGVFVF